MVQQKYNDDTNQLNTIIKHLQTLWNLTRNLLGKYFFLKEFHSMMKFAVHLEINLCFVVQVMMKVQL